MVSNLDPAKFEAIRNWPDLKNIHEVRSFLGFCSYYRRFIRHFAEITSPLHALSKKLVNFRWEEKEIAAFEKLKERLCSHPVIVLPDLHKPFVLQCDASGHSIGVVLMQERKVIAYESRLLQNAEHSMSTLR